MAKIMDVSEENYHDEVEMSSSPVLMDFWAPWCGYCIKLRPVLEAVAKELDGRMKVVAVNVDRSQALARKYGVMSLPTLLLTVNGAVVEKTTGYLPKQALLGKLKRHL